MASTRVDRWLWAVRCYKTRAVANTACAAGHVSVNEVPAKPSTKVKVGDRVQVRVDQHTRDLEVIEVIEKRVGAPRAAECMVDHNPPPAPEARVAPVFERDRGTGRPTKRDRRQLDRHRNP